MTETKTPRPMTYGVEGTTYPVKPGQVWKVGEHVFLCSDLMQTNLFEEFLRGYRPTLHYVDPPWNNAMINGFRTKAGLPRAEYTYLDFYRTVINFLPASIPLFVESGNKEADGISALLRGANTQRYGISYDNGHPASLHYSGPIRLPASAEERFAGLDDSKTPAVALSFFEPGLVVDPSAGRGLTSLAAAQEGWRSVNNELSPYRMSSALVRLSRRIDSEPVRVQ